MEIQKRYELSMPLLKYLTDTFTRLRDPTVKFLERLQEYRALKNLMIRKHTKDVINNFLAVLCIRDQENLSIGSSGGLVKPNKTKREQIFEELNTMIGFTKRLEFQIKKCIDTPIKMFKILKAVQNKQNPYGKEYLNEDLKQEDLNKIAKYTQALTTNPFNLVEFQLLTLNFNEFVHTVQLLESQKALYFELKQQPLLREGFEEIQPFDINDFKEYVDKARKIYQKIRQINDFEVYDLDHTNNLRTKDVQDLIEALKMQHDFIYETEQNYKIYLQLKARIEQFCNKEFVTFDSTFNCIEVSIDEFEQVNPQ
eukprot:403359225